MYLAREYAEWRRNKKRAFERAYSAYLEELAKQNLPQDTAPSEPDTSLAAFLEEMERSRIR